MMIWNLPAALLALTVCAAYAALTPRKARHENVPELKKNNSNVVRFINMGGSRDVSHWAQPIQAINYSSNPIRVRWAQIIGSDFDLVVSGRAQGSDTFGTRAHLELEVPANLRRTFTLVLAACHEDWRAGDIELEFLVEEIKPGNAQQNRSRSAHKITVEYPSP